MDHPVEIFTTSETKGEGKAVPTLIGLSVPGQDTASDLVLHYAVTTTCRLTALGIHTYLLGVVALAPQYDLVLGKLNPAGGVRAR